MFVVHTKVNDANEITHLTDDVEEVVKDAPFLFFYIFSSSSSASLRFIFLSLIIQPKLVLHRLECNLNLMWEARAQART